MSVQKLKTTIVQLERKRNKRRLAVRRLQEEHDQLLLQSKAMDLLVQHQDIVARMLHHYFRPCSSPPPSIADDTGFIQPVLYGDWPLLADFKAMRLADYNWLLSATAQQVGACCFHHLQHIAVVMNRRSAQQQADIDKAVGDLLFLTKAMYILTPGIVYALKDVNLMTGQLEPPPSSHWERAFCATEASLDQLALFQEVLQQVVPRMEQLEMERQELAACINSVKALTLKEQSAHAKAAADQLLQQQREEQEQQQRQQEKQQKEQQQGRIGASRAAGLRRAAVQQVAAVTAAAAAAARVKQEEPDMRAAAQQVAAVAAAAAAVARVKQEEPDTHAQLNGWHPNCAPVQSGIKQQQQQHQAATNGFYTSLLQQAVDDASPPTSPHAAATATAADGLSDGCSDTHHQGSNSNSSSTGAASMSTSTLRYMRGTCKDMVADMDARLLKWRTLSGARSAVTFILKSEQIAGMLLAAFPYMPMMACMCDYVPAAHAAALQREKQQQQHQMEKQTTCYVNGV